jgi:hypothetical protein
LGRLENVFSGKSTNTVINLLDGNYDSKIFIISTQLETQAIRIELLEIEMNDLHEKPFTMMRKFMEQIHGEKEKVLEEMRAKQEVERETTMRIEQIHN